jgi:hypothetical protein
MVIDWYPNDIKIQNIPHRKPPYDPESLFKIADFGTPRKEGMECKLSSSYQFIARCDAYYAMQCFVHCFVLGFVLFAMRFVLCFESECIALCLVPCAMLCAVSCALVYAFALKSVPLPLRCSYCVVSCCARFCL